MTNPVETAVAPLKQDAVNRAEENARSYVARLLTALEANGFDLNVTAPRAHGRMSKGEYQQASAKRSIYQSITSTVSTHSPREPKAPTIVKADTVGIEKFVAAAKEDAALQYDSFVAKLVAKVGDVKSAELTGNHVWGFSFLRCENADGSVTTWKTQQIVNVSKLGLLFNQWPTRKVK